MKSDAAPVNPPRCTEIAPIASAPIDHVTLTYQERYRRRCRLVTDGGRAIILDLAELTELRDGAALVLACGSHIAISAAAEPLAAINAAGADLARLAWHIGNRHTPCQIGPDHILIQRDHVLEEMLCGLGAAVSHVDAPFQPEGGAYGHGRTHGHAHSHDPHEDPNAHIHGHAHHHHG
ncbi:MAG: urease accessory protein UreE [Pseudomonadota bacterium]